MNPSNFSVLSFPYKVNNDIQIEMNTYKWYYWDYSDLHFQQFSMHKYQLSDRYHKTEEKQ